ncbi:MAG: M13 family metallopeptidase, partial [Chlorobiales bacterium]|nr:M13 family metallopeptidase [Chlorobiales bacterium]
MFLLRFRAFNYFLLGAVLTGLTSCSTTGPNKAKSEPQTDLSPTVDFYKWANSDWLKDTQIPSDKPGINNFVLIQKKVNEDIVDLLGSLKKKQNQSPTEQKIAILYDSYMDVEKRNALGLSPLMPELRQIDDAKTHADISVLFSRMQKLGVESPLIFAVMTDFKNSDQYIVFVSQSGLGIERDNYVGNDERSLNEQKLYREVVQKLFEQAQVKNAAAEAESVLKLEKGLADIQWSKTENRQMSKIYNVTDYNGLKSKANRLNIERQMVELGMPTTYAFNVMQPSYLDAFNRFFISQDVQTWKTYLKARLLLSYAKLLDKNFKAVMENYEIKRGLYEVEEPLSQQAVEYLNTNAGMLLGKTYVENKFNEGIKSKLEGIIKNIADEYRIAINESPRMTGETKKKAVEKLDKITYKIGYPDKWQDYSSLEPVAGELVQNHKRIQLYEHKRNLGKLGKPIDKNDWGYPPQVVNAFYELSSNSFVLLAAILYPPFFNPGGTDAEHYGGIGFVIGHEIGHGFDDQGSRFDGNGNMVNWWSPEDSKAYDKVKNALIAQANKYEILPGKYLKGELEIGEIMGDLSGAEISLRAYQKIIKAKHLDEE